jgi:hypothetical protein
MSMTLWWSTVVVFKSDVRRALKPGMVVYTCNPSTYEAEARGL